MAITAQIVLNVTSTTAGATPPPVASLIIVNSGAVAVSVIGASVYAIPQYASEPVFTSRAHNLVALGPGQNVTVPAGGTLTMGPFPIAIGSAAYNAPTGSVPPGAQPGNPQISQPTPITFIVGGRVITSDGATTSANTAGLILGPSISAPFGNWGGSLAFSNGYNLINGLVTGIL